MSGFSFLVYYLLALCGFTTRVHEYRNPIYHRNPAHRLEISQGQALTLMGSNLNMTDTDTSIANLAYTVSNIMHGFFARRAAPATAITTFTQAEVNGGVIRFVHDGSANPPSYLAQVSGGSTTTSTKAANVTFTPGN